ncbi:uracil-DNA glycosylase-like [Asterias rubens]|uniref:uracil-DNA glycosylase-like n=1 Tax=Asterias rubens TaxID=7604 RepID=UPI001455CCF7|nr:uracil-DNA glycosylase-like [Asterias rubens]
MIGQRKISSFFKVASIKSVPKRQLSGDKSIEGHELDDQRCTPPKRQKSNSAKENGSNREERGSSLSPEQKQRMELQRLKALKRLESNGLTKPIGNGVEGAPPSMGPSWASALSAEFTKPYFLKLHNFVKQERQRKTIYPPANQVYTWTNMCPVRDVKVVILGQDPYHGPGQAHGLCFSVQKGVPNPPSLANMFKELSNDIEGFQKPSHGDLTGWARQGVLLLNAVLTVEAHRANSHKDKGWETFTNAVIAWLNKHCDDIVFLLWGSYAHKKGSIINTKRHHVLKGVHPSPLSAYRGFFGCKHFSKTNDILKKLGKEPIDWGQLNAE